MELIVLHFMVLYLVYVLLVPSLCFDFIPAGWAVGALHKITFTTHSIQVYHLRM